MFEQDALVELGKFKLALRQAQLCDRIYYGKRPDYRQISSSNLDPMETYWLIYTLAPLHYCNGHHETARQLLELGLGFWLYHCSQISSSGFGRLLLAGLPSIFLLKCHYAKSIASSAENYSHGVIGENSPRDSLPSSIAPWALLVSN